MIKTSWIIDRIAIIAIIVNPATTKTTRIIKVWKLSEQLGITNVQTIEKIKTMESTERIDSTVIMQTITTIELIESTGGK